MKERPKACFVWREVWVTLIALAIGGLFVNAQQALAQTVIEDSCMEEVAGQNLKCTANDVQLAEAYDITILDDGCAYPNDYVTFQATFEVVLTAQERHDIGIYFATDGDPNDDGALSGSCTISTVPYQPFLDLDGTNDDPNGVTQDTCGDIDANHNPLYPVLTITTKCIDPDHDGKLNLPNCTSWRQPGANELCTSPLDAFPGSPSKCRCDIGFNVDIDVPAAALDVLKTATPTFMDEPGGQVTFSIAIKNTGIDPENSVILDSLTDSVYGNLLDANNPLVPADTNHCLTLDTVIGAGETVQCTFEVKVSGNGDYVETDIVTASGADERGNAISGSDDASVTIKDVLPTISLVKTATPSEVNEPGGTVTFTIDITNNSVNSDPVTIDSLTDTIHGDPTAIEGSTCKVPQTIQSGMTYSCSFTVEVSGNKGDSELDEVTASGTDDEGNPVSAFDTATVVIKDVMSSIKLTKTANPTSVDEPGGNVEFTFTVENTSEVDTVTINKLDDSIYGDLTAIEGSTCKVPQTIPAGGSYTCSALFFVESAPGVVTNIATASGIDDDGESVSASGVAEVTIHDVPPSAKLTKFAAMADVTYNVTVTNTSGAEDLTLKSLIDDVYGDVADSTNPDIVSTTCAVPQVLAPNETYECSFVAKINGNTEVLDTVTGTVWDDEDNYVMPYDTAHVIMTD